MKLEWKTWVRNEKQELLVEDKTMRAHETSGVRVSGCCLSGMSVS